MDIIDKEETKIRGRPKIERTKRDEEQIQKNNKDIIIDGIVFPYESTKNVALINNLRKMINDLGDIAFILLSRKKRGIRTMINNINTAKYLLNCTIDRLEILESSKEEIPEEKIEDYDDSWSVAKYENAVKKESKESRKIKKH